MNQTNRLLVWFMIYNFKVNYSKDNFFFPIILIDTPKSNTERRWETILINSRQSKKKKKKRITHVPKFGELAYQAFIYYNFNLPKSIQKRKKRKKRITHVPEFSELRYKSDSFKKLGRLVLESTKLGYQSA